MGRNGRSAHRVLGRRRTRGHCPERGPAAPISARLSALSAQLIDTRYQISGTGRRTTRLDRYRTSNNPTRSRAIHPLGPQAAVPTSRSTGSTRKVVPGVDQVGLLHTLARSTTPERLHWLVDRREVPEKWYRTSNNLAGPVPDVEELQRGGDARGTGAARNGCGSATCAARNGCGSATCAA